MQDNNIPTESGQKVLHIFGEQSPKMEEIFEKIHHRHALVASLRLIPYDMLTDLQRHQDFQFAKLISPAKEKKSLGTVPPCPKKEGRGFYLEFDKDAPL